MISIKLLRLFVKYEVFLVNCVKDAGVFFLNLCKMLDFTRSLRLIGVAHFLSLPQTGLPPGSLTLVCNSM